MDFFNYTTLPHPTAFAGLNLLSNYYGIGGKRLGKQLSAVNSYTRNREVKKPVYNPIFVRQPRRLMQADLLDKQQLKRRNSGIAYWLIVMDTFTRYAWIRPLRNKNSATVADAFQSILDNEMTDAQSIRLLLTDRGGEFTAPPFRQMLQRNGGIKLIHPNFHAPHVERLNRTLQSIIGKYLTEYATARFVDIMAAAVSSYNNRRHRVIKMSPVDAEKRENQDRVRLALEQYYRKKIYKGLDNTSSRSNKGLRRGRKKEKFAVGDLVRKVIKRSKFFRAFHPTFEETVYRIGEIHDNLPTTLYSLVDLETGESLRKKYYPRELQLVSDLSSFKISHVFEDTRRRNPQTGEEEVRVAFEGLPRRYAKFVPVDSIDRRRY